LSLERISPVVVRFPGKQEERDREGALSSCLSGGLRGALQMGRVLVLEGVQLFGAQSTKDRGMAIVKKNSRKLASQIRGKQGTRMRDHGLLHTVRRMLLSEYFILYLTLLGFLVLWIVLPSIATPYNIGNILANLGPLLAVAVGQTLVLIIGGIDLSQTASMGMTSIIGSILMSYQLDAAQLGGSPLWGHFLSEHGSPLAGTPWAVPLALLAMLATGMMIGLLNGTAIAWFRMPPFIVTLISMTFFQALAIWLTKSENIFPLPDSFDTLGNGSVFFVPLAIIIALVLTFLSHILLRQTVFGRQLYAIGANQRTAVVSGLPTKQNVMLTYTLSGLCASVGAILYTAQIGTGTPTLGSDLLLDVIGAVVIGGTSLFGGVGKVLWTVFGALFFVLLDNSLNLLGLSYYTVIAVKGAVVLFAVLFNVIRVRIRERR
jgi:ribose/xylose/arabinose/galactoside ABC-type transport system permease subunit